MSATYKAYLLSFFVSINVPVLYGQEPHQQIETTLNEWAAKQKEFDEQRTRIVEGMKKTDELLRHINEQIKELEQLEKIEKNQPHKARIALYTLLTSLGLLLIFLRSYIAKSSRSFSQASMAAQYALSQGRLERQMELFVLGTGLIISGNGLAALYKELHITDQIKKVIKLIKRTKNEATENK